MASIDDITTSMFGMAGGGNFDFTVITFYSYYNYLFRFYTSGGGLLAFDTLTGRGGGTKTYLGFNTFS